MTGTTPVRVTKICRHALVDNEIRNGIPDYVSWHCSLPEKARCRYLKDFSILCANRDGILQERAEKKGR